MEDIKTVTVRINVSLLRQQRDALHDMEWTDKNIHILYGITNLFDFILDEAEGHETSEEADRLLALKNLNFKITGFDKKTTEEYKRRFKGATFIEQDIEEEDNGR